MSAYLARQVELYLLEICHTTTPTVEQIQDAVEKILIEAGHARTAKEYILYRAERTRVRDMNTKLMHIYEDLTFKEAKDNDVKRENANIDGNTAIYRGVSAHFPDDGTGCNTSASSESHTNMPSGSRTVHPHPCQNNLLQPPEARSTCSRS